MRTSAFALTGKRYTASACSEHCQGIRCSSSRTFRRVRITKKHRTSNRATVMQIHCRTQLIAHGSVERAAD